MDSPNLDLVRSIYTAWGRGDWSSAEWAHPEIEFVIADGPSPFATTGVRGMAEQWRRWLSAWEGFGMEAEEFRELDDERVLVLHRYSGRGKTSGVRLEQVHAEAAIVMHVREGKVTRLVAYNDRENAFTDLAKVARRNPAERPR
jgi:ketosteroid isomerase-like protein